jgi:hypothetical protein
MVWLSVFAIEAGLHQGLVGAVAGRFLVVEKAPQETMCSVSAEDVLLTLIIRRGNIRISG